jgi:cytochrome c
MAEAQKRMPNRQGMTTQHGLWPGRSIGNGKPDVQAAACMSNCATEATVKSFLPDFARNAHGNLAEQNRVVGAQHGADTTRPPGPAGAGAATAAPAAARPAAAADPSALAQALARKHNCLTCHGLDNKVVGPALRDVARKYAARPDAAAYLAQKISAGGSGIWGAIPMPPQTLPADDVKTLAQWLSAGAK